jgi:hypothetical protein
MHDVNDNMAAIAVTHGDLRVATEIIDCMKHRVKPKLENQGTDNSGHIAISINILSLSLCFYNKPFKNQHDILIAYWRTEYTRLQPEGRISTVGNACCQRYRNRTNLEHISYYLSY